MGLGDFPLATSCEELTHWKRLWCWEGLGAGGEGDNRGWDGWMASLTPWTWVWVNSGSWWWTGRPGVLWFMGLQRVGHDWVTELNWTELVVQWLRNHAPNAGSPGLLPGQGTRSHVPRLSSRATTKTQHSEINIYIFKKSGVGRWLSKEP